ncbi:hypothetical protein [Amycolatopsis lexingtonensis]|uniref:hypothetical protein n=1 Tax=Amycolatopsis lexingtonensis TaxID=218822 RepID=UPI003F710C7E
MNARTAAVACSAVILIAGCSTNEPNRATTSSAAPATTDTMQPGDLAKQQATAAYLGMWNDMADAATTSDWQSPKLAQNATSDALQTISRSLYADHSNGLVTKGRPVNHPRVQTADPPAEPTTVTIADCGDSTSWLKYRADNGQLADDGPGGRRRIEALVKKAIDGSWKVTTFAVHEVGSCAG